MVTWLARVGGGIHELFTRQFDLIGRFSFVNYFYRTCGSGLILHINLLLDNENVSGQLRNTDKLPK